MSIGTRFVQGYQVAWILGALSPGALLNFYVTGTSERANTYSDVGLTDANPNPVVADGNGNYPSIFLDPTVTYKVVQTDQFGANETTADPVDSNVAAIVAGLGLGSAAYANLGTSGSTVPLNNGNITWGGLQYFNALVQLNAGMLILPPFATFSSQVGYLGIPVVSRTGNYTFATPDSGSDSLWTNNATATIPTNAAQPFSNGELLKMSWPAGFTGSVAAAGGVTLRWLLGNLTTSRTVTGPGYLIAEKMATNEWWCTGVNVTAT